MKYKLTTNADAWQVAPPGTKHLLADSAYYVRENSLKC